MNKTKHTNKLLTIRDLTKDEVSADIGYWKFQPMIHGKQVDAMIVEDEHGRYMLGVRAPNLVIIGTVDTKREVVLMYNNFVSAANAHDLAVVLGQQPENTILIGR